MVLRESGRKANLQVNVQCLVDPSIDCGVPASRELLAFADAVCGTDIDALAVAREALAEVLGPAAVSGASIIAANFCRNDRLANAVGIPLDPPVLAATKDLVSLLGMDKYASAANSLK